MKGIINFILTEFTSSMATIIEFILIFSRRARVVNRQMMIQPEQYGAGIALLTLKRPGNFTKHIPRLKGDH
jgi:hypothetical protein